MDIWMMARVAPTTVNVGEQIEVKVVNGALCAKVPAGTFALRGPPDEPPADRAEYAREGFVGTVVEVMETIISADDDHREMGSMIKARATS
ncbi:MAG: hypothetical protein WCJ64_26930 [Rhodospirillaceae bacterium]